MNANIRRARIAMLVGAVLLALAVALTLWEISGDDDPEPAPVTGALEA